MALLAMLLLGWCLLSLPIGIVLGRLLRTPTRARAATSAASPIRQADSLRPTVLA